jgi:hypothetical protein
VNRLVEYHARDSSEPSIEEVIDRVLGAANAAPNSSGLTVLISNAIKARIFEALFRLGADPVISFSARAILVAKLNSIKQSLPTDAVGQELKRRVETFASDPERFKPLLIVKAPPGSPIGGDDAF